MGTAEFKSEELGMRNVGKLLFEKRFIEGIKVKSKKFFAEKHTPIPHFSLLTPHSSSDRRKQ
jgi:hypothetical protein